MTIFKTYLKLIKSYKAPIIMYTVFLVFFAGFNMQSNDTSLDFEATKPDVLIVNKDEEKGITKSLIDYLSTTNNIVNIKGESAIDDALFYRDINYIIYINENFRESFLKGDNPEIEVKSTGDYQASLASMTLEKYLNVASSYKKAGMSEEEIIENIKSTLSIDTSVSITSKLDTTNLTKITRYYNFLNYSMLAGCVYVICLILSTFKSDKINKRTIISSISNKELNRNLLLSNCLFSMSLWLIYVILSFFLIGESMFTSHGLIYILNSFVFSICSLTIAFLIGNIVNNKNALNGIINVIALGSSFLCGAFVPMEWLPDSVLAIAHVLPSYWFIKSNELIKTLEEINLSTITPILINMLVVIIFSILFIIATNIISNKRRKI